MIFPRVVATDHHGMLTNMYSLNLFPRTEKRTKNAGYNESFIIIVVVVVKVFP